ncbi:hypothetical protein PVAND_006641 [Polypedilum vanderplanki]|uniref:Uncharacterized protein n=1 Tax=Polypedilum vanderplanki TaxID=319348 RepID=A0A9J6C4A3_POLVA|nr:hypothetical protein PVAND_006641 [Polypedilum vanderplanki]
MKIQEIFLIFLITISTVLTHTIFLDQSMICTLVEVGSVPAPDVANVHYPVFERVCREILPRMLADSTEHDETLTTTSVDGDSNEEISSKSDEKIDKIRQALLSSRNIN